MKQFNLEEWLQDKSRKVVTRDRRPVRILCTDAKAKDGCCIIAAIETDGEEEGYQFYENGRAYSSKSCIEDCADLFFADEEEELTEFEKMFRYVLECYSGYEFASESAIETLKLNAKSLLDLARKEILKDLPKWKKATEHKEFEVHVCVMDKDIYSFLDTEVNEGEYYIELSDLKTLSKEE